MAAVAADYDSRAVREAARKLKAAGEGLSADARPKIEKLLGELDEHLEGEAAEALRGRLNDSRKDVNTVLGTINALVRALNKYADELDRAAQELKKVMA